MPPQIEVVMYRRDTIARWSTMGYPIFRQTHLMLHSFGMVCSRLGLESCHISLGFGAALHRAGADGWLTRWLLPAQFDCNVMWPLSLLIPCRGKAAELCSGGGLLHQPCYSCWKHQRYSAHLCDFTPQWPPENVLLVSLTQLHGKHLLWRPLRQTWADPNRLWLHCGVWCWQDLWCQWRLSPFIKCSDAEGGPQNFVPLEGNCINDATQ